MNDTFSYELVTLAAMSHGMSYETLRDIQRNSSHEFHAEVSQLCEVADLLELGEELEMAVSSCRLSRLRDQSRSPRPDPYNHKDLAAIDVDEHGLVKATDFDQAAGGFAIGDTVFEMLPSLHNRISTYFCLASLNSLDGTQEVRVRFDPFMRSDRKEYCSAIVKMFVFGKTLSWDSVVSLHADSVHKWIPDPTSFLDVSRTDAMWSRRDREVHFCCEECPTEAAAPYRPSRYFHTIIDTESRVVTHCDGAIRIFTPAEARQRAEMDLRDAGKFGTRIKIFQFDGPLESKLWSELFQAFFVWNDDIKKFAIQLAET